jgi:hypothetical protein
VNVNWGSHIEGGTQTEEVFVNGVLRRMSGAKEEKISECCA